MVFWTTKLLLRRPEIQYHHKIITGLALSWERQIDTEPDLELHVSIATHTACQAGALPTLLETQHPTSMIETAVGRSLVIIE